MALTRHTPPRRRYVAHLPFGRLLHTRRCAATSLRSIRRASPPGFRHHDVFHIPHPRGHETNIDFVHYRIIYTIINIDICLFQYALLSLVGRFTDAFWRMHLHAYAKVFSSGQCKKTQIPIPSNRRIQMLQFRRHYQTDRLRRITLGKCFATSTSMFRRIRTQNHRCATSVIDNRYHLFAYPIFYIISSCACCRLTRPCRTGDG